MNLEKELIRQNRKLATPEELLVIREFETHTDLVENDALSRIGINKSIKEGKKVKAQINKLKDETSRFNQERVFHISQIESTCKKYHLKFLASSMYHGSIDKSLPTKITNFEAAYGVKCGDDAGSYYHSGREGNTFIMAPAESFKLQERPKDPLLFYKINEEYFYLIHKWGNDLNPLRGLWYGLLTSRLFFFLVFVFGVTCNIMNSIHASREGLQILYAIVAVALGIIWIISMIVNLTSMDEQLPRFTKTSDEYWRNPYKD